MDTTVAAVGNDLGRTSRTGLQRIAWRLSAILAAAILLSGAGCSVLETINSPPQHSTLPANHEQLATPDSAPAQAAEKSAAPQSPAPKPAVPERSAALISPVRTAPAQPSPAPQTSAAYKAPANANSSIAADASNKGATRLVMPGSPMKVQARALITPPETAGKGTVATQSTLADSTPQQIVIKGPPRQPTPSHFSVKWLVIILLVLGACGIGGFAWHEARRRSSGVASAPAKNERPPPGLDFKEVTLADERITEPLPELGAT